MQGVAQGRRRRAATAAGVALGAMALLWGVQPAMAGSVKRVNFRADAGEVPSLTTFFDGGGLILRGACATSPSGGTLQIRARSKYDDAMIHVNSQSAGDDGDYAERDDFDTVATDSNDDWNIFGPGAQGGLGDGANNEDPNNNSGQIVYARPGGKVVSVDWASEQWDDALGGTKDCAFVGTARVLDSGSSSRVNFRMGVGHPVKTFQLGGLELNATCDGSGDLSVTAGGSGGLGPKGFLVQNQQSAGDENGDEFHSGGGGPGSFFTDLAFGFGGSIDNSSGQLVYSRGEGVNVTVDWMAEQSPGVLGGKRCVLVGTARKRSSGDPKRVNFRAPNDTPFTTAFSGGGLTLRSDCGVVTDDDEVTAFPLTAHDDAMLHANQQGNTASTDNYFDRNDMNVADAAPNLLTELDDNLNTERSSGQLIYARPGGVNVTVDYAAVDGDPNFLYGDERTCAFVGTAEVATP